MSHEIDQLDIPDRQLRVTSPQPRVSLSREIGEAVITHTIFGKAKVRIIRKHDKLRRALWLTALLVLAAIAWQAWFALQRSQPSAEPFPAASTEIQTSVPAFPAENILPPSAPLAMSSKTAASPQTEIIKPALIPQSAPHAAQVLVGQTPAKPVASQAQPIAPQPLAAIKPQAALLAAGNSTAKSPAEKPLPAKPILPNQPAAVAKPPVTQPVVQPASSPAAAVPRAAPLAKEVTPAKAPAADKQPAEPVNMQSK